MPDLLALCDDLAAEHEGLDRIVAPLGEPAWDVATPAEPWSVRDQISHLTFFDEQATTAATAPAEFAESLKAISDLDTFINGPLAHGRALRPDEVLQGWREARQASLVAFRRLDPSSRVPWFGPPMSPMSFVSARLMETWAHGQDVIDGLGVERAPTPRLRHVAHLGVRARAFSYSAHGKEPPAEEVRVELVAPDASRWTWNDSAEQSVAGSALDFCLLVTQRRHRDDTDLVATGPLAHEWLSLAQAFAGPPGEGRKPGQFRRPAQ